MGRKEQYPVLGTVAIDREHDLVLLEVGIPGRALPLEVGTPDVGENVYAVGNPQGLEGTFSEGIVSGVREVGADQIFQVTAPISPGSSGGPVLNDRGQVVGVATATFQGGQNLNFAVPSSYLSTLLQQTGEPTPLSFAAKESGRKLGFAAIGERGTAGVVGEKVRWGIKYDFHGEYSITLRNKLQVPVENVYGVVIFYDRDGLPIDTDVIFFPGMLAPGLATRVNSEVDVSVKPMTTNKSGYVEYSFTPATKVEFRVLNFSVLQ